MDFSSSKLSLAYPILVTVIGVFHFAYGQAINEDLKKLATANNIFALNLHRILSAGSQENVFFSPLSVSTVFGMLLYGVKGESAKELRQALGYDNAGLPDDAIHPTFSQLLSQMSDHSLGYTLLSANAILVSRHLSLRPQFERGIRDLYHSPVTEVDFARDGRRIVGDVNGWVAQKTKGMIRKVLEDVSPMAAMILLNAVYFKGTWKTAFRRKATRMESFYNGGSDYGSKRVPMMIHKSTTLPYTSTNDYQAVELPYTGDEVSMLVILPNHRSGLTRLEQNLTSATLDQIRQDLSRKKLEVHFPRFKMEFSKDLVPDLHRLGIEKIFRSGSQDFSGISASESGKLSVTDVVHKSKIEVNEEGTEAAASTSMMIRPLSAQPNKVVFRADHPFVFCIVDKRSGVVVFMGRVSKL